MNKGVRIVVNLIILAVIGGFAWYMIRSVQHDGLSSEGSQAVHTDSIVSPYKKVNSIELSNDITGFDIDQSGPYISTNDSIFIYDTSAACLAKWAVESGVCKLAVRGEKIYLLYPTKIAVYTFDGKKSGGWEACSDNADYCSFVFTAGHVFVTDAENKNICQYTLEGNFVKFIQSPDGFIIPSYAFDIININDTLYCANSGRHQIESYTASGEYITSFGKPGSQAGAFAGCCNPVYLAATPWGDIITSEKGNPRISCYDKNGKYRSSLLTGEMMGGGTTAYDVQVVKDGLYIVGGNTVTRFIFDPNVTNSSCAGCEADCPMRKGVNQ